ncbi:titin [Denticeps clupeoides]|nr:titin-like [Denticeps clupeoides]
MTETKRDQRRFHNLTQEQVETLDQVLTEVIPIHGRGNFPTLEVKPKDIIHVVRAKLIAKEIRVRDVRLNGSTASHVLVKENGTSYKDLDIIFGVELPKQEDFQIIKEVVLGCLLDFLPHGVNKDKITPLTMKEAYVQKMVKVFTEHDRWSLISLSNNSGKNVELKFVHSLRRQFEFSVDSFQIILDSMLESYLEAERRQVAQNIARQVPSQVDAAQQTPMESVPSAGTDTDGQTKPRTEMDKTEQDKQTNLAERECNCENEITQENGTGCSETVTESAHMEDVQELSEPHKTCHEVLPEMNNSEHVFTEKLQEATETRADHEMQSRTGEITAETDSGKKSLDVSEEKVEEDTTQINWEVPMQTEQLSDPEELTRSDNPAEPMQVSEKGADEPDATRESFMFQPLPSSFVTETAQDLEDPVPPPAKKNTRSSQMVVLKHSSPKPPRKMSKKVTGVTQTNEKASTNLSCKLLHPPRIDPSESMPMQIELPGNPVKSPEPPASASQDKQPQINTLDISAPAFTAAPQGGNSEAEKTLAPSQSPELPALNPQMLLHGSEQRTDEHRDQNTPTQPFSLKVPPVQTPKPVIQVNSQPLILVDDPLLLSPGVRFLTEAAESAEKAPDPHTGPHTGVKPDGVDNAPDTRPELSEPHASAPESSTESPLPDTSFHASDTSSTHLHSGLEPPQTITESPDPPNVPNEPASIPANFQSTAEAPQTSGASASEPLTLSPPARQMPSITVVAESMYGDFEQAMDHLRYRLIATRNPEEIRGGGLLKYSNLLVRDFKPASETEIKTLERYMCSRFFIDFPDVNEQQRKIESYLRNHFIGEEKSKYDYLMTLRRVVNESTVCLMGHERRQTLNMITILALKVLGEQNIIPNTNNVTCYYQPAPYMTDHNFSNYYIASGQSPLVYHPYPLHIHMQTGLV